MAAAPTSNSEKLAELEGKLAAAEEALAKWSKRVEEAIESGDEKKEEKYREREALVLERIKALETQISELRQSGSTGSKSNQLTLDFSDVAKFITKHLERELQEGSITKRMRLDSSSDTSASVASDVIALLNPLFGVDGARKKIYVRNLMPELMKRIVDWLESDASKSSATILGGNRGCGKTVIGMLVVLILASKGHVVLYEHRGRMMLVMPDFDQVLPLEQEMLQKRFDIANIPLARIAGAYVLFGAADAAHHKLSEGLLEERIVFVQDVGDSTSQVAPELPCRRLIVTSPNAQKLAKLDRLPGSNVIILPTWTKEEIDRVDARVLPEVVNSRFERMRGIPRWVCDSVEGKAEERQDEQIKNLTYESLKAMVRDQVYAEMPTQIDKGNDGKSTDLVIRLEPQDGDDSKVTARIISDYVEMELAHRFVEAEEFNVQSFMSATEVSSTLAHFRGYVVEAFAHRALTKDSKLQMTVQMLSSNGVPVQHPPSDLQPALHFPSLRVYVDMKLEAEAQVGVYYRPKRKNEPTVDGWGIVRRAFVQTHFPHDPRLADASIEFFIVFFQVTISESHVVDGTVLGRFIRWAKAKLNIVQLPVVFVFITTVSGIRTMQTVTLKQKSKKRKPFENQAQFGCQYAIQIRGTFEDLAGRLQAERIHMEASTQEAFDSDDGTIGEE